MGFLKALLVFCVLIFIFVPAFAEGFQTFATPFGGFLAGFLKSLWETIAPIIPHVFGFCLLLVGFGIILGISK